MINKDILKKSVRSVREADRRLHSIWTIGAAIIGQSFLLIYFGIILHSLWGWGIMVLGFVGLVGLIWCREEFFIREGQLKMKWKQLERIVEDAEG